MSFKVNTEKQVKHIEDINSSINDLDLDSVTLIRGKTPQDINQWCLQLCKDYLSGEWIQQTVDTITVSRITVGVTNQMYCCAINEPNGQSLVPQVVAIRLYGKKYFLHNNDRLVDTVIALMMSTMKIGPKMYGIFDQGQILQFYNHRPFKINEQNNAKLVRQVFEKLAQIHAMDVPIKRNTNWLLDELDISLAAIYASQRSTVDDIKQLFNSYRCPTLLSCDFPSETQWIKDVIKRTNSPVVFTHNDYRSDNLMVIESPDSVNNQSIVVCDFDYSAYGYRGYDFALILREWHRKRYIDVRDVDGIPQDDQIVRPLIEIYVNKCNDIHGSDYSANDVNSVDHILYEIKVFQMVLSFFGTIHTLKLDLENQGFFGETNKLVGIFNKFS
ncbi:choline/ethanolamine kinase-like [Oppia nitens]|uniref:choline/ethanolamine kinase-like n=1 Tax=Oppia nitens TaxID=1686743 RepID=UPI0023DA6664|nr:choline/ethanolamine kinase-like [Oppia nitens]